MPWWLRRSGTNTRQGKRQGQAASQRDPPSRECNADITKIKTQEVKSQPDARLRVLDTFDGQAQPGQYGCCHCCFGRGSACPSGRYTALRLAAFAQSHGLRVRGQCSDGARSKKLHRARPVRTRWRSRCRHRSCCAAAGSAVVRQDGVDHSSPSTICICLPLIRHATRAAFSGTCPGKQFIFLAAVVSPASLLPR